MAKSAYKTDSNHRIALSLKNALIVVVVYAALFAVLGKISGVSYTELADNSQNFFKFAIIPLFFGGLFLTIIAFWAGWWKDLWRDKYKIERHNWLYLLPILIFVMAIITMTQADFSNQTASFVALLALGGVMVGYSEELLFRGIVLQGARGSGYSEMKVLLITATSFALLHGLNIINGQDVVTTIKQIIFAFVVGAIFYVIFRKTGFLVVTMFLHGLWDFSSFLSGSADTIVTTGGKSIGLAIYSVAQIVLVILFLLSLRYVNLKKPTS